MSAWRANVHCVTGQSSELHCQVCCQVRALIKRVEGSVICHHLGTGGRPQGPTEEGDPLHEDYREDAIHLTPPLHSSNSLKVVQKLMMPPVTGAFNV